MNNLYVKFSFCVILLGGALHAAQADASDDGLIERLAGGGSHAPGAAARLAEEERRLLDLINRYREANGLHALAWSDRLAEAAAAHNDDMTRRDYFGHCGPDATRGSVDTCLPARLSATGYRFRSAAENLAAGQRTPLSVLRAWQASPGHDSNLLAAPMTEAGVDLDPRQAGGAQRLWTLVLGQPAE